METKAEFSKMLQDGRHPGRLGTTHRFLIAFIAPFLLTAFFYVMSISPSASRELAVTAFFCGGFSVAALLSVAVAFLVGWSTPRDLAVFLFSAALLVLRTDPVFSNFVEARAPGLAWVWLPVVSAVFFWSHMRLVRFLLRLSPGSRLDRVIFWGFVVPNFALLVPLFALPAAWDFFYFAKCFHSTAWGVLSLVLMLHCAYVSDRSANRMIAAASLPFSFALCVNLLIVSGAIEPMQLRFFELCILWMMLVLCGLIVQAQMAMAREARARELKELDRKSAPDTIRVTALNYLGDIARDAKNTKGAIDYYRRASEISSTNEVAHLARLKCAALLSESTVQEDRFRALMIYLTMAESKDPKIASEALFSAAMLGYHDGRYDEAAKNFHILATKYASSPRVKESRIFAAWSSYLSGRSSEALAIASPLRGPANEDAYYITASSLRLLERRVDGRWQTREEGVLAFKKKLEKSGINVSIRRVLGRDIDGACGQLRHRHLTGSVPD